MFKTFNQHLHALIPIYLIVLFIQTNYKLLQAPVWEFLNFQAIIEISVTLHKARVAIQKGYCFSNTLSKC